MNKFTLLTFISLFLSTLSVESTTKEISSDALLKVIITFDKKPSQYDVKKALLKYNKDFAYSFTFDDSPYSAYYTAYFLMNGGDVLNDLNKSKTKYPGLFYTDGCGNNIPFKAGIAWNSKNGKDLHENNYSNKLTWDQLKVLYNSGWDILNHAYSHATTPRGAKPAFDHNFEVTENVKKVKEKIGFQMTHFVIPTNDTLYFKAAFENGMKVVYTQDAYNLRGGKEGININNPLNDSQLRIRRHYLSDENYNPSNIHHLVQKVAKVSNTSNKIWYNEFTHDVSYKKNGGSIMFPTFEFYMKHLEKNYGKSGADNMWMAPLQEVYEYLTVRDNVEMSYKLNDTQLEITFDLSKTPKDLRRYALSLLVNSENNISKIEVVGAKKFSYNEKGKKKLVNLEWDSTSLGKVKTTEKPGDKPKDKPIEKDRPQTPEIEGFKSYPNPFQSFIKVEVDDDYEEVQATLFNLLGKIFYQKKEVLNNERREFIIDLSHDNLSTGIYLLKLQYRDDKQEIFKMIKK